MFLTSPSIEELLAFELTELIDLLAIYTADYMKYVKNQGHFYRTNVLKEYMLTIQAAIEIKRTSEKNDQAQTQQSPAEDTVKPEQE